jgi:hypothetical protein
MITEPPEQIHTSPEPPPGGNAAMTRDVAAPGGVTLNCAGFTHWAALSPQMIGM